ncbi:TetR/AcrR family transcriptional regulator [Neobacillus drentensis]|uniref:TetR/AcrR family transcriptional regulator n=2 Tax=Neobacillus drentensis TaxID=220684 RepID=UPI000826782E|nr:TetR/AcrR family transcriptional regulator [Neobacillus drentensis]
MARKSREEAKQTRNTLNQISLELFIKKGYQNTTIDDICKKAGVTKGAFYNHFKNKGEIILSSWFDLDEEVITRVSSQTYQTNKEELIALCKEMYNYVNESRREWTKAIYTLQINDEQPSYMISKERRMFTHFKVIIQKGQEQSEFRRDMDAGFIAHMILIYTRGIIFDWMLQSTDKLGPEHMTLLVPFFDTFDPKLECVKQ